MKSRTGISNPSSIEIQDEGVVIANKRKLNFVGPNVEASLSGDKVVISIPSQAGGISTHNLLTAFHQHPAGASGNVLTNLGSGAIPTYAAFVGGMATHAFLTAYHGHPAGASGNVLTNLGSGAIPTYTTPGGGVGTHALGSADHVPDTWANLLTKISNAIPIKVGDSAASLALWAGHIGSASAHHTYPIPSGGVASGAVLHAALRTIGPTDHHTVNVDTHASTAAAHHAKYTDVEAKAAADVQVSIHTALVGVHHSPTHNLGGADHNPDTWANFLPKVTGHNVGTLGGTIVASQHPNTHHQAGGISPLFHKRSPAWFIAGTLAVGSQLSARFMADGPWTNLDIFAHSRIAPSGGQILVDVKKDGTSIFGSLPYITTGTIYAGVFAFATTGIPSGEKLQLDLMQVGSSHAGEDLTIQLICKEPVL